MFASGCGPGPGGRGEGFFAPPDGCHGRARVRGEKGHTRSLRRHKREIYRRTKMVRFPNSDSTYAMYFRAADGRRGEVEQTIGRDSILLMMGQRASFRCPRCGA